MRLIGFLLRHSWKTLGVAVLTGAVSGAASAGLLSLMNSALNRPSASGRGELAGFFAGLCVFAILAMICSQSVMVRLGQGAVRELRTQLSDRILATPLRRLEIVGPHRLLVALTDDVGTLSGALTLIPTLTINFAVVVGALVYLGYLSPPLFGFFSVALLLGVVSYYLPMRHGTRLFRKLREERDLLFGHFRGVTEGVKGLKLHRARREALIARIDESSDRLRRMQVSAMTLYISAASWGQLLVFVVIGVLLFVPETWLELSRAALTGYTVVLMYMMTPLQVILNSAPQLTRASVTVQKLRKLGLSLEPEPALAVEADRAPLELPPEPAVGAPLIELRNVRFTYRAPDEDREFSTGPVDLVLRAGELVFLTGGNGSGKTTLGKILVGLYPPDRGELLFRGRPVTAANLDGYRQQFSVVFSDFFLFDSLLGLERADLDQQAGQLIERLQLGGKVDVRDGVFSTLDLSQGQRKRLALLVAYLEDRDVFLFDEWAADQDPPFKAFFYERLLPQLRACGKTVIVITHDDAYYGVADRILKLDFGRIVGDRRPERRNEESAVRVAT